MLRRRLHLPPPRRPVRIPELRFHGCTHSKALRAAVDSRREKGSALILVLWVIAILSMAVSTTAFFIYSEMESGSARQQNLTADLMAEKGLAIAVHPLVRSGDPILATAEGEPEGYRVWIESETSRLNINALLARGQRRVLEDLFTNWGMEYSEALALVDALQDWVDSDEQERGQGAEREAYAAFGIKGAPFNRPFLHLDEMSLVRGMDLVSGLRPDWKDAFTLWGDGRVNLMDARPDVIQVVCQCSIDLAERFVEIRKGPDGLEHTQDDLKFEDVEDALNLLGAAAPPDREGMLSVTSEVTRIRSVGWIDNVRVEKSLIVQGRESGGASRILDFYRKQL